MAIANPWILIFGSLLVAVPIALHLLMQRKPQHLVFPALQFVRQRCEANRRRLRLRHWLLLLLRCLIVLLLAAALARPSAASELISRWGVIALLSGLLILVGLLAAACWILRASRLVAALLTALALVLLVWLVPLVAGTVRESAELPLARGASPVAAAIVVDTSPRMQYRYANRTRLEQAQQMARWLVERMPPGSQVAIVDCHREEPFFSVDLAAASKRIEALKTTFAGQSLVAAMDKAVQLLQRSKLAHKELYVLTDLTEAAWRDDLGGQLRRRLQAATDVALQVIDVGVKQPENYGLSLLHLDADAIPVSGQLHVIGQLQRLGPAGHRTVELQLEKPDLTRPVMLDRQLLVPEQHWTRSTICKVSANSACQFEFYLGELPPGVHQGRVRIVGEDGFPLDDERYFTVEVRPPWQVLVVQPPGGTERFLTEALAPYELRRTGRAGYQCTVISTDRLEKAKLQQYNAVALLDVPPLPPAVWEKLADYVAGGAGVAVFLGHNAKAEESFNGPSAQRVLAGQLDPLVGRSAGDLFLTSPAVFGHPITAALQPIASTIPWRQFPIHRYWVLRKRAQSVVVVLRYSNGRPALLDRTIGHGHALTMTTPVSDPSEPEGRRRWNDLPLGNAWPYFMLVNQMFDYLVASGQSRLQYLTGQTAVLLNDTNRYPASYDLFRPQGPPQPVRSVDGRLVITATNLPGAYRLRGSRDGPVVRGFSVNMPADANQLARADEARLDLVLGKDRYRVARSLEEIGRKQGESRIGRQFYPYLVIVLAGVLAVELLMANRFYRKET